MPDDDATTPRWQAYVDGLAPPLAALHAAPSDGNTIEVPRAAGTSPLTSSPASARTDDPARRRPGPASRGRPRRRGVVAAA